MSRIDSPIFRYRERPGRAFTLLEVLVVMAIIVVIVSLSSVSIQGIGSGHKLTTAMGMVTDQIALARQTAISKNARVEWQLIKVPSTATGQDEAFRLIRLRIFEPKARRWRAIGRSQVFPVSIIAAPESSTLLAPGSTQTIEDLTYEGQSGQTAEAAMITFHANGRLSMHSAAAHSITLLDPKYPNNFVTIQIDPVFGQTRTFRP